jgi:hypothetical protein
LGLLEFVIGLLELTIELVLAILELCELCTNFRGFSLLVSNRIGTRWPNHDGTNENGDGGANGNKAKTHRRPGTFHE